MYIYNSQFVLRDARPTHFLRGWNSLQVEIEHNKGSYKVVAEQGPLLCQTQRRTSMQHEKFAKTKNEMSNRLSHNHKNISPTNSHTTQKPPMSNSQFQFPQFARNAIFRAISFTSTNGVEQATIPLRADSNTRGIPRNRSSLLSFCSSASFTNNSEGLEGDRARVFRYSRRRSSLVEDARLPVSEASESGV